MALEEASITETSMRSDPHWFQALLAVHIAAGILCLVVVPLVLAVTKGSRRHRRRGKLYFWLMCIVAGTAMSMALYHPAPFLASIAILTFYLAYSGYRAVVLKDASAGGVDWAVAIVAFASCTSLAVSAVLYPAWVQHMGIIAVILGAVGARAAGSDLYRFARKPARRTSWLHIHFERFLGSYIAAWTAFSVVTLSRLFPKAEVVVWLWPLAIGIPVIAAFAIYYRRNPPGVVGSESV